MAKIIKKDKLVIANTELADKSAKKGKRESELVIKNKALTFQIEAKNNLTTDCKTVNVEQTYQNKEKNMLATELGNANYARSLIEASLDPLFTINTKGKVTDINNASLNVTGKTRNEIIGTAFYDYFTEPSRAKVGCDEVFEKGFVADFPLTIKDHKLTDVLFNGSVYKDINNVVIGIVVVARDITEQKRFEKELTESKILAEQAALIAEEAKIKAENALQAKQQFLSNMSHEIRTPMNAIIGFTKVILKTELNSKQKEYLNAIKVSGDTLIVLINDILDLAKVDSGKMVFEKIPFRIKTSIDSMVHLFENRIHEKNLEFILDYDESIPEILAGDSVRLHQIIINLLSNAIKFTTIGSIKLKVILLSQIKEQCLIKFTISDTGIGISEKKTDKIFENFQQASSSTSRLFGGTGLGLAIVKQLVEAQGGSIKVKSKLSIGSEFSFELAFSQTAEKLDFEMDVFEIESEIKNIKILVVEDIALNQLLMKTLLDDFGFERDVAANGKIAIQMLKEKEYDIVLMDLQMPEMNGFEATEHIRKVLKSKVPIIALTADVTTADVEKCKIAGMNDYIAKPVDDKLLYNKIISLVMKKLPSMSLLKSTDFKEIKKVTNLNYLILKTKNNTELLKEMITAYLEQTPSLIMALKQCFKDNDWLGLNAAAHKMIPSFAIMGMNAKYEDMIKKIQGYAKLQEQTDDITHLVLRIEEACLQACNELIIEYAKLKNK